MADRPNTVSVGSPGHGRQITNVAPGTLGTDAVKLDQLRGAISASDARINRTGALASALAGMSANAAAAASPRGRFAIGAGFQNGKQALSVGYGRRMGERSSFTLGGAFSGSDRAANVGFGVDL